MRFGRKLATSMMVLVLVVVGGLAVGGLLVAEGKSHAQEVNPAIGNQIAVDVPNAGQMAEMATEPVNNFDSVGKSALRRAQNIVQQAPMDMETGGGAVTPTKSSMNNGGSGGGSGGGGSGAVQSNGGGGSMSASASSSASTSATASASSSASASASSSASASATASASSSASASATASASPSASASVSSEKLVDTGGLALLPIVALLLMTGSGLLSFFALRR